MVSQKREGAQGCIDDLALQTIVFREGSIEVEMGVAFGSSLLGRVMGPPNEAPFRKSYESLLILTEGVLS